MRRRIETMLAARPSLHTAVGSVARAIGRRRAGLTLALTMQEAARVIVKYTCTDGIRIETNGELQLANLLAPKARTFMDVGANVGNWAAPFLAAMPRGGKGVLFDPSNSALQRLQQRFATCPEVQIQNVAVSDSIGEATFFEEPAAGGTSSMSPNYSQHAAVARTVAVTTLDAAAQLHGFARIDVLKIDAEGHDLHVLRGARQLLAAHCIGVVQFEYSRPWMEVGSTLTAAYNLLEPLGYRMYLLSAKGLFDFPHRRIGEWFGTSNFIAVSPDWRQHVRSLECGPF